VKGKTVFVLSIVVADDPHALALPLGTVQILVQRYPENRVPSDFPICN
jgi:hypothetical protein